MVLVLHHRQQPEWIFSRAPFQRNVLQQQQIGPAMQCLFQDRCETLGIETGDTLKKRS